jgi:hypothetical protein
MYVCFRRVTSQALNRYKILTRFLVSILPISYYLRKHTLFSKYFLV